MKMAYDSCLAFLVLLLSLQIVPFGTAQDSNHQTIVNLEAFSQLDACVQTCFTAGGLGCSYDILGSALQCATGNPCALTWAALDDCYCRSDKQSFAESYISACVKSGCTAANVEDDISSGWSVYGGYCTSKGFLDAPASASATTTAADFPTTNAAAACE
jgi:hypothetical protein